MPPVRIPTEVHATPRQFLGMPPARFLCDYWQKHPLLVRGAFPDFAPPLSPDDLAGLACMDGALARIVQRTRPFSKSSPAPQGGEPGSGDMGKAKAPDPRFRGNDDKWKVVTGPFDDTTFTQLPESHWTLLVQDVDKWDADTAALLDVFAFIPSWRIDDVMISYAADQGGVGAHVDQYDVFLLQGLGARQWSIDAKPNPPTDFRDDAELKLLKAFSPSHEWVLQSGDMLYLPPGVPHDGVAIGECMTFSIGMRAPSAAEMLADFAYDLAGHLPEELRYADPDLQGVRASGEIDDAAMARVMRAMPWFRIDAKDGEPGRAGNADGFGQGAPASLLRTWFGCFITRYRTARAAVPRKRAIDRTALPQRLPQSTLERDPWSRFAWCRNGRDATLFVAGHAYAAPPAWARALSGRERVLAGATLAKLPQHARGVALLADLIDAGHLRLRRR